MARRKLHSEIHYSGRTGWLRAAVLGANDGIVSTASLVLGVAAGGANSRVVLLAGVSALIAGAMSMAAGEYVSVSSQADTQRADLEKEREELRVNPAGELRELAAIYMHRGLKPALAEQVAEELMKHDALEAHAREELGITETSRARPVQAAFASALSFAAGAAPPLIVVVLVSTAIVLPAVGSVTALALVALGLAGAYTGGAPLVRGALRVTFWGLLAMGVTTGIGSLMGHFG